MANSRLAPLSPPRQSLLVEEGDQHAAGVTTSSTSGGRAEDQDGAVGDVSGDDSRMRLIVASPTTTTTTTTTTTPTTTPMKLYHRDDDLRKLVDAYENRHLRHLVLVVGPAGCGKTSLIQQLRSHVEQQESQKKKGFFVQGRFDDLDHPDPFAPWIDATEQLLEQLIDRCDELELASIMKSVHQCMEVADMEALATLIPLFGDLMNLNGNGNGNGNDYNYNAAAGRRVVYHFVHVFGSFLRAVAHPSRRPIVWFLDQLHHADDPSTLEVLKLLVGDSRIPNMLAIVAFRPVHPDHPASVLLQSLEGSGVGMVPIVPSPIDYASIYEWLDSYDMKGISDYQKDQMANTMADRTEEGNALTIQLCLSIMYWNQDIVRETSGTPLQAGGNATKLFPLLFQMLSTGSQTICRMAACMGTVVDVPHLAELLGTTVDIPTALAEAERYGILQYDYYGDPHGMNKGEAPAEDGKECGGEDDDKEEEKEPEQVAAAATPSPPGKKPPGELQDLQCGCYRFANSTYRELVYNLLTFEERTMKHAAIGTVFRQHIDRVGIFRVVVHMALGADTLSPKAKELLVEYCLEAGRRASQWGAFVMSAKYLQLGIALLVECPPKFWKTRSTLITELYCDTAQVASQLGKYPQMEALLDEAMNQAKHQPSHRLLATKIQMQAMMVQMKYTEAIAIGLSILKKIHEPIRNHKNASFVDVELNKTGLRKLLEADHRATEGEDGSILSRPSMTDPKMLGVMDILDLLLTSSLILQGDLIPHVACRMVRLTYKHGLARSSPLALCYLGVVLCLRGEIELGVWCSDTGVTMVETVISDKTSKGRVMTIHWGLLSRFVKPWRICQEPLKVAYRTCIKSGDTEFSMLCPVISTMNMMAAGVALPPIAEAMKSVYQLLQRKNQDTLQRILRPFYQLILNLMGVSPEVDASVLTGTIMKEDDDLRFLKDHPCKEIECCLLWCQTMIAFYLHEFGRARELLETCRALFQQYPHVVLASMQINLEFWNAMTAVRLLWFYRLQGEGEEEDGSSKNPLSSADKKRQTALLASAKESLHTLEALSKHASDNVEHKVLMVQGQLQALEGELETCMNSFQRAIEMAGGQEDGGSGGGGSIADKAIFCEHAGLTLRQCGEEDHALDYLEDCCTSYREWGALIKVNHVKGTVIPEAG